MDCCSKSRRRITLAPAAMAVTLRPRSRFDWSEARSSFAAAATSACEMSGSNGGPPSTPTSIVSVRRPPFSIWSRRKENSSPLVSRVPIRAMVLGVIALSFRQFARGKHPAFGHRAKKGFRPGRRIDGNQFQWLPVGVHGGVEDVGRNVDHVSGADWLPLLAIDIDHL